MKLQVDVAFALAGRYNNRRDGVKYLIALSRCVLKSMSSSRCHEAAIFKIHTSVHIEFGPMAVLSSW